MECDLRCILQRSVCWNGGWEPWVAQVLYDTLRQGDVFVDVGAHVGYHTLHAARIVGPHGTVLAFEPLPPNLQSLLRNLSLNESENVLVYSSALGNSVQSLALYQAGGANTLMTTTRTLTRAKCYLVACLRFDDVVPRDLCSRVRLVKIDVEGAELSVLRGMRHVLSSPSPPLVICEVIDRFLREVSSSAAELLAYMSNFGYAPHVLARTPTPAGKYERVPLNIEGPLPEEMDVLFIPGHGAARSPTAAEQEQKDA